MLEYEEMEILRRKKISKKEEAIIIGSLLGDGYLDKNRYGSTALEIKQKASHRDYIFWLHQELKNICGREPYQRKDNFQWRLLTRYGKELNVYYDLFYENKKKVIKQEIKYLLKHPLSLAVWYMDDGTLDFRSDGHYAYRFATYCFSKEEIKILVEVLENNFNLKATIQKSKMREKIQYRLYIGKNSRIKFKDLIQPYIVKSFRYKLPYN